MPGAPERTPSGSFSKGSDFSPRPPFLPERVSLSGRSEPRSTQTLRSCRNSEAAPPVRHACHGPARVWRGRWIRWPCPSRRSTRSRDQVRASPQPLGQGLRHRSRRGASGLWRFSVRPGGEHRHNRTRKQGVPPCAAKGRYQFNTGTAKHYFCSQCGIYTHHQRRSNPGQYGYNVGCLEGVNPFNLAAVPTKDGVNHPADRPT